MPLILLILLWSYCIVRREGGDEDILILIDNTIVVFENCLCSAVGVPIKNQSVTGLGSGRSPRFLRVYLLVVYTDYAYLRLQYREFW